VDLRKSTLENLVVSAEFWRGRRVFLTGHTGFKGAWLSIWLTEMGAVVTGFALAPKSHPNLFELAKVGDGLTSVIADINDQPALDQALRTSQPEIVFHLAAQALVRESYQNPVETFAANVGGTVTLLDSVRRIPSVRAILVVTSDKCYDNQEWVWGYRENDRLGGRDPYSASKGCTEIAARSMQMSFYAPFAPNGHPARIATVRAGNVIGGGDWSDDRLIPDIVRGCLGSTGEVRLRHPQAVRPWQHVLDPLGAYIMLAQRLATAPDGMDEAWNIGPENGDDRPVVKVAGAMVAALGTGRVVCEKAHNAPHEAKLLQLDCEKARTKLGWRPRLKFDDTIRFTAEWYAAWQQGRDMAAFTRSQISAFAGTDGAATGFAP
jgi:CDP-glucose 4,6-dehydratase